jgi:hypothetical protein
MPTSAVDWAVAIFLMTNFKNRAGNIILNFIKAVTRF